MTTANSEATSSFDWQAAHARLTRMLEKLDAQLSPPTQRVEVVLRERARRYAATRRSTVEESWVEVIGFSIAGERFAIQIDQGTAVAPLSNLTALPGTPSFYLGLVSHRGSIYPVIDPRPLLGVSHGGGCNAHYAVLIRGEHGAIGLAGEEIQGISRLRSSEVAAIAEEASRFRAILGIGPQETMIIDSARLLQDARLLVDDQPLIADN